MPWGCSGTFTWVLGPRGATGMQLAVARRSGRAALQAKAEVGAVTAVSARATLQVNDGLNVRLAARLGTMGADLEVWNKPRGEGEV
eukprot:145656-Chlamydomonas_euryale.AAC.1